MPQGWVTTARGEALNMDELKDRANLPLAKAKQTKTEVPKRDYRARPPINVRGFQPVAGEHKVQAAPEGVAETVARLNPDEMPVKTSFTESGDAETLADVTGIKLTPSKAAIERAAVRRANTEFGDVPPPEDVAGEALTDILGDLEAANPNAQAAADAEEAPKRTRSRKKTTSG